MGWRGFQAITETGPPALAGSCLGYQREECPPLAVVGAWAESYERIEFLGKRQRFVIGGLDYEGTEPAGDSFFVEIKPLPRCPTKENLGRQTE